MKKWKKLPTILNSKEAIRPYYDSLKKKWAYRFFKRASDIILSFFVITLAVLPGLVIGLIIIIDSKGGMFFCQNRVGRYGKEFKIIKFRTMKKNSEGDQHITHKNDSRVTKIGGFLRKTHLDELPQALNVFIGQMSFVGTRPEVKQFVDLYKNEWFATLLSRPGITSTASYTCDDEAKLIEEGDADNIYLTKILPIKMEFNLSDILKASVGSDIKIMWRTVFR